METHEEILVKVGKLNFEFPKGCAIGYFHYDEGTFTTIIDRMNE